MGILDQTFQLTIDSESRHSESGSTNVPQREDKGPEEFQSQSHAEESHNIEVPEPQERHESGYTNVSQSEDKGPEDQFLDEVAKEFNFKKLQAVCLVDGSTETLIESLTEYKDSKMKYFILIELSEAVIVCPKKKQEQTDNEKVVPVRKSLQWCKNMNNRLELMKRLNKEYKLPDMKIITGFDKDFISSISKCEYFGDDIPMLIIEDDNSQLSKAICSFLDGLKTAAKEQKVANGKISKTRKKEFEKEKEEGKEKIKCSIEDVMKEQTAAKDDIGQHCVKEN